MNPNQYERKEIYTLEEVFSKIQNGKINFDGDMIKMSSHRYILFKTKGVVCIECQLAGTFFTKEKCINQIENNMWHLNLYGINKDGKEVMFTKDHIIPKSKGGPDKIENYQTMCQDCNSRKGNGDYQRGDGAITIGTKGAKYSIKLSSKDYAGTAGYKIYVDTLKETLDIVQDKQYDQMLIVVHTQRPKRKKNHLRVLLGKCDKFGIRKITATNHQDLALRVFFNHKANLNKVWAKIKLNSEYSIPTREHSILIHNEETSKQITKTGQNLLNRIRNFLNIQ